ncbi:MAG: hypothetical protein KF797_03205 [Flavobacteriales bacterium]|nr:hypothetical protein [Flavobacteriales bacterium]
MKTTLATNNMMQRFLTLLGTIALMAAAAHAQIAHDLTVFSEDGKAFTLVINGQAVNAEPATSVTAPNINFDYAKVVVRFADGTTPDIERKNLQIATPGTGPKGPVAAVYAIKEKKGEQVLRFVSRSDKKIQNTPVIIIN